MAFHKNLGDDQIHRLYDQVYADDAARDADTTWNGDSTNIGKAVLVTSDDTVFMLVSVTPSWFEFGGTTTGIDTIYNGDADVIASRVVTIPSARSLEFKSYNLLSSSFTLGADIHMNNGEIDIEAFTGDGAGGTNAISRLLINTTTMQVLDQINSKGFVYAADYSANYTDRSIVDKAYVDTLHGSHDTLAEILANGNTSGGTDMVISTGDVVTLTDLPTLGTDAANKTYTDSTSFFFTDGVVDDDRIVTIPLNYFLTLNAVNTATDADFTVGADFEIGAGQVDIEAFTGDGLGGVTARTRIAVSTSAIQVLDQINNKGMVYAADYSANYTATSIIDKNYADSNSFYLNDGTITGARTVTAESAVQMEFVGYDTIASTFTDRGQIIVDSGLSALIYSAGDGAGGVTGSRSINIGDAAMTLTDEVDSKGIVYAADYTANYTARSLVDKSYVDNHISHSGLTFAVSSSTDALGRAVIYQCTDTAAARTLTISSIDIAIASTLAPWVFTVVDVSGGAGTNSITIDTEGAETINGVASIDIAVDYGSVTFICDGSNLFIKSSS